MPERRTISTSFLDVLFIVLLALLILTMPKQPVSTSEIEQKAEFLVETEWTPTACSDIDTWMRAPGDVIIYYSNKQSGLHSLDRDDLGCKNDQRENPDGTYSVIHVNREMMTLRGFVMGRYTVNLFAYSWEDSAPITATVRLIRLNPYRTEIERQVTLYAKAQEITIASWSFDRHGNVHDISLEQIKLTGEK